MTTTMSPAAALARHDHRYWHKRFDKHLEWSERTLRCPCALGGRFCATGQEAHDKADSAGLRWARAEGR